MKVSPLLFGGLALVLSAVTASATVYTGNGGTGFGGPVGNGVLTITSTATNINFVFSPGTTFNSNDLVFYIDSEYGGANNTSTYTDTADGGRSAISGLNGSGRTLVTFASGFGADFGVSFEPPTGNSSPTRATSSGLFDLLLHRANFAFVSSGGLVTDKATATPRFPSCGPTWAFPPPAAVSPPRGHVDQPLTGVSLEPKPSAPVPPPIRATPGRLPTPDSRARLLFRPQTRSPFPPCPRRSRAPGRAWVSVPSHCWRLAARAPAGRNRHQSVSCHRGASAAGRPR